MIIVQLSDPHIRLDASGSDDPSSAPARLQQAVRHVRSLPAAPDVVLITGDCTDHGRPDELARFRELIAPLTAPVFVVPGNHDDRDRLRESFGPQGAHAMTGFMQYVADDWPVRLIGLDTVIPGRDAGELCSERLRWLDERLAEAPERPTLIFMHHPPFATGLDVLDQLGLAGADALGAVVSRHPQVERIVAGHIHCVMQRRFAGTLAMTCTSTAMQIRIDLARREVLSMTNEPPSCLVHAWSEHMGLVTHGSPIGDHGPYRPLHDGVDWVR